tara:strand:+ start:625 stop:1059 length:435 start_codon:yes stop_codon:yes gene_type:complete
MAFKMRGYTAGEGTGSMAKQKNKGHMEGPIPEQNIKHQDGNEDDVWIYGRGYKGEDPKVELENSKESETRLNNNKNIKPNSGTEHVKSEKIIDLEGRIGFIVENDLPDLEGDNSAKANKKRKSLQKTVKTLEHELQIQRDRTDK